MATNTKKIRRKNLGSYPNFTVVFSISLALFTTGLFLLLILHANKLSDLLKDKFEVHVYLDKDISTENVKSLKKAISDYPFIVNVGNNPQIRFVSKEEAAKQFIKDTGEDFYKILGDNPLRPSFVLKIDHTYANSKSLKNIKEIIGKLHGVHEVDYRENLINQINKNIKNISFILVLLTVVLLITSIILINNTLRLALFSQRFLIRSMQLVGAHKWFIQKPFITRAILQGIISSLIAIGLLLLLLNYLYNAIPDLRLLADTSSLLLILAGLVLFGVLIAFLSSWNAVNKYLKMSLDQLY